MTCRKYFIFWASSSLSRVVVYYEWNCTKQIINGRIKMQYTICHLCSNPTPSGFVSSITVIIIKEIYAMHCNFYFLFLYSNDVARWSSFISTRVKCLWESLLGERMWRWSTLGWSDSFFVFTVCMLMFICMKYDYNHFRSWYAVTSWAIFEFKFSSVSCV